MVKSHFCYAHVTLRVALSPEVSHQPVLAIKKQINDMLFKYHDDLGGIPLTYGELKFEKGKEYARIIGEFPWLHVNVQTKLLLFKPRPGQIVPGTILKMCQSHISLLIYGIFNASITSEELSKQYNYDAVKNLWINEDNTELEIGKELELKILTYQESQGVINIVGVLPSTTIPPENTNYTLSSHHS